MFGHPLDEESFPKSNLNLPWSSSINLGESFVKSFQACRIPKEILILMEGRTCPRWEIFLEQLKDYSGCPVRPWIHSAQVRTNLDNYPGNYIPKTLTWSRQTKKKPSQRGISQRNFSLEGFLGNIPASQSSVVSLPNSSTAERGVEAELRKFQEAPRPF